MPATTRRQDGMVTAETALGMGALVVMVLGLLWVVAVVTAQVRCIDAARDAARAVARGDSVAVGRAEAGHSAPDGAQVRFRSAGGLVEVDVVARARPPWSALSGLGAVRVHGHAAVALEPGEPGANAPRQGPSGDPR